MVKGTREMHLEQLGAAVGVGVGVVVVQRRRLDQASIGVLIPRVESHLRER